MLSQVALCSVISATIRSRSARWASRCSGTPSTLVANAATSEHAPRAQRRRRIRLDQATRTVAWLKSSPPLGPGRLQPSTTHRHHANEVRRHRERNRTEVERTHEEIGRAMAQALSNLVGAAVLEARPTRAHTVCGNGRDKIVRPAERRVESDHRRTIDEVNEGAVVGDEAFRREARRRARARKSDDRYPRAFSFRGEVDPDETSNRCLLDVPCRGEASIGGSSRGRAR